MTPLAGIHDVALTVRDRDASAEWNASVLRFEELFREDSPQQRGCVMRFPGGAHSVGLVDHTGGQAGFDSRRIGLDHLAFTMASRTQLDGWALRLTETGVGHDTTSGARGERSVSSNYPSARS